MSIKDQIEAQMGETLTLVVKSLSAYPNAPKTNEYQGKVSRAERWDPPETFRMTGTKDFPTRVIRFSNVVSINGSAAVHQNAKDDAIIVLVKSSKGDKNYTVVINANGRHTCDCPGFPFRKTCRHIKEALEKVGKG